MITALLKYYETVGKVTILKMLLKIIVRLAASYARQGLYAFRFFSLKEHLFSALQALA
jgi:hypothetical protein